MKKIISFICVCFFCLVSLLAQLPDWGFLDYEFKIYDQDGNIFDKQELTARDMIAVSLSFSLCKPNSEEWNKCFEKYDQLVQKVKSSTDLSQKELAEHIMDVMHADCLTKYGTNENFFNKTFLQGRYNCVTSSLLYMALAKEFGIDARVQLVPEHMFVTVYIDGKAIDVECTNKDGFEPGTKKIRQVKNKTVTTVVPKKNYRNRKERSERVAISRIASNNASALNDDNEYELAIPLVNASMKFILDEDERIEEKINQDKLFGNYAIKMGKKEGSDIAIIFLEVVMDLYGKTPYLLNEYADHAYNSMVDDFNAKRYDAGFDKLEKRRNFLTEKNYTSLKKSLDDGKINDIHNQMADFFNKGDYENAKKIIQDGLEIYPENKILLNDLKKIEKVR